MSSNMGGFLVNLLNQYSVNRTELNLINAFARVTTTLIYFFKLISPHLLIT